MNSKTQHTFGRFAGILADGDCDRQLYDVVLGEVHNCIVAPTLGAIVPNWLLIIPRTPSLNFAQWSMKNHYEPRHVIDEFLASRKINNERAIWFEHGPAQLGSAVACGADYAHLHLLVDPPFSFNDFISTTIASTDVEWYEPSLEKSYSCLANGESYFFAASANRAISANQIDGVGSQFFRRVVAKLVGQSAEWDYKNFQHLANVSKTVTAFGKQAVSGEQQFRT